MKAAKSNKETKNQSYINNKAKSIMIPNTSLLVEITSATTRIINKE